MRFLNERTLHNCRNRSLAPLVHLTVTFPRGVSAGNTGTKTHFFWSLFLKAEVSPCAWCDVTDGGGAAGRAPGRRPRGSTEAGPWTRASRPAPAPAAASHTLLLQTWHTNGLARTSSSRDSLAAPSIMSSGVICVVACCRISSHLKG